MTRIIHGERIGRLGRLAVGCSAGIFDATKQKILLVHRADTGTWCVPGGYMEPGESVTEGCMREVWEETGLHVRVEHLIAVYNNPHILLEYPDGNRWQIVALYFAAAPVEGDLRINEESTAIGYFSREEIGHMVIGRFDRQRIADAFLSSAAI